MKSISWSFCVKIFSLAERLNNVEKEFAFMQEANAGFSAKRRFAAHSDFYRKFRKAEKDYQRLIR
jgi:hypothetical protein